MQGEGWRRLIRVVLFRKKPVRRHQDVTSPPGIPAPPGANDGPAEPWYIDSAGTTGPGSSCRRSETLSPGVRNGWAESSHR